MPKRPNKTISTKTPTQPYKPNYWPYFAILLLAISAAMTAPFLIALFTRKENTCHENFDISILGGSANDDIYSVKTVLIGELHGENEHQVAECITSLATSGDRLLIEAPNQGAEIACDEVHSAYKPFNKKLKCYGFDVSMEDEARLTYADSVYRANFIAQHSPKIFQAFTTRKKVINGIKQFADI